eukprot:TRINITY_DN93492_c0_g1_i1.p1 TRINITY_DN93492_c0_g1~~TRINITY_DN93492_c0_g1_i1.p1  ORF type:complete len:252 (+),score=55.28 TRINITY_DN93492_c0_g1_i1:38-793(+)
MSAPMGLGEAPKAFGQDPLPKPGSVGYQTTAPPLKNLSAYEQKMLRRLDRANRRAAYEAAGVPLPEKTASKLHSSAPTQAGDDGPDHERLLSLAREAREQGNLFFYYSAPDDTLKVQAKVVSKTLKEEEALDENVRLRNEDHPESGIIEFFQRLEEVQQEERSRQIEQGEIAPPKPRVVEPAASSAGKPHEVVMENGSEEEGGSAETMLEKACKLECDSMKASTPDIGAEPEPQPKLKPKPSRGPNARIPC